MLLQFTLRQHFLTPKETWINLFYQSQFLFHVELYNKLCFQKTKWLSTLIKKLLKVIFIFNEINKKAISEYSRKWL